MRRCDSGVRPRRAARDGRRSHNVRPAFSRVSRHLPSGHPRRVSRHMAKGNRPVEVRVDDESRARWETAARDRGYTLSEFVRAAVDDLIERETPKKRARASKTAAPAKVVRAAACEHRIPPTAFCGKCD